MNSDIGWSSDEPDGFGGPRTAPPIHATNRAGISMTQTALATKRRRVECSPPKGRPMRPYQPVQLTNKVTHDYCSVG